MGAPIELDARTLIPGIVSWMRLEGVAPTRTRLVKFLYLADVHYARHHAGHTVTGWRWYVDTFGPFAEEFYRETERGVAEGWLLISEPSDADFEGPGAIFYDVPKRETTYDLVAVGKVRRWIKDLGDDTNRLLRFVYGHTEPMEGACEGDVLDFTRARPTDNVKPLPSLPIGRKTEKRFRDISARLRDQYRAAREQNAEMHDGPRDAAYFRDLPADDEPTRGEVELSFAKDRE